MRILAIPLDSLVSLYRFQGSLAVIRAGLFSALARDSLISISNTARSVNPFFGQNQRHNKLPFLASYSLKNPEYYAKKNHPEYADIFGVDDFGAGFIRLEGGIILDFRIAWAMHLDSPGDTIFMGTKGSLRIPATECWNGSFAAPMKIYHDVAGESVETVIPMIKGDFGDLFYKKIRSFLDAIKEGGKAPIPSEQIIINQAIIDGIVKSNALGREIEINIPEL